jgi:hypothetical protein
MTLAVSPIRASAPCDRGHWRGIIPHQTSASRSSAVVRINRSARLAAARRWRSEGLEGAGIEAEQAARGLGDDAGGARDARVVADLAHQRAGEDGGDRGDAALGGDELGAQAAGEQEDHSVGPGALAEDLLAGLG